MTEFICREAANNEIKEDAGCESCTLKQAGCCITCSAGRKIIRIRQMPAADVRPVARGKWVPYPCMDDMYKAFFKCSVCGKIVSVPHGKTVETELPFCNCGACMNEEANHD